MTAPELSVQERATVDRIEQAPDALGLREEVAEVVAGHAFDMTDEQRVNGEWTWGICCECGEFVPDAEVNNHLADALLPIIERREAEAAERGVAVAAALLYKAIDYWNGRPVEHHGHHIYADLCAVLRAITPVDRDA